MPQLEEQQLPYQERLEKRVRALEALAHPPLLTYPKGVLDSKIQALVNRLEQLEARLSRLEA